MVRRHRIRLWGSYRKVRDCVANTIGDGARHAGDAGEWRERRDAVEYSTSRRRRTDFGGGFVLFYFWCD